MTTKWRFTVGSLALVLAVGACGGDGGVEAASTTAAESTTINEEASTTTTEPSGEAAAGLDPCDVATLDLESLVGFAVDAPAAGRGSLGDFEFESCAVLESDATPDTDGTTRPRSVAVQVAVTDDPKGTAEDFATSGYASVEETAAVDGLPEGSFVTEEFGLVVLWVPTDQAFFGVSVAKTKVASGVAYDSDLDATRAVVDAILAEHL